MNQAEVEQFAESLGQVGRQEAYGYLFFFIGEDNMRPFMTIAQADNEYDRYSNLDREGVFRVNIGISGASFKALLGDLPGEGLDYSVLNVFLPHPEYAKQHFVCILNPEGDNAERARALIREAHGLAAARHARQSKG